MKERERLASCFVGVKSRILEMGNQNSVDSVSSVVKKDIRRERNYETES